MKIKYPKGQEPEGVSAPLKVHKPAIGKRLSAANRGMDFEADINQSCLYYEEKGVALITKRPTPINVVKVDYTKGAMITHAYFEKQSTTDYNGVYKGRYLDFEAKSTRSRTSLPLANIAPQQIEHLEGVMRHGGIAFFLINCSLIGETYLLPADWICRFYREKPRKSIPIAEIKEHGFLLKEGLEPRYDYLKAVEEAFFPK